MTDWSDHAWLAQAHAWIDEQVAALELTPDGPREQVHVRPWATAIRIPTTDGPVWFKASIPALGHEAGVVDLISQRRPDLGPKLLASDGERGWMLMTDGGERLREVVERERDLGRWLDLLPKYAELQIAVAADADELVRLGVPDRRLAVLPSGFAELEPPADELERVCEWCNQLGALGIPETLQHDDLHDGQIFIREGRYLFFDWGDACVSHPFCTLAVTLEGVLRWGLDDVEGSVDINPFRDAYLEPFEQYGSHDDLVAATEIAMRLGWISRALYNRELDTALGVQDEPKSIDEIAQRLRLAFQRAI